MPTFRDIYSRYRDASAKNPTFADWSLGDFASASKALTGDSTYDQAQGYVMPWLSRGSYWLDEGLNKIGAPKVAGDVAGWLGEQVGVDPTWARSVGEGLPRSVADFAPMIIGGLVAPEATIPAMLASGALSGANAYEKTGSAGAAALGAATPLIGMGGFTAGKALTGGLLEKAGLGGAELLRNRVAQYLGGQIGAAGAFDATQRMAGNETTPFFSKENLFQNVVGQLPFVGFDLQSIWQAPKAETAATMQPKTPPMEQPEVQTKASLQMSPLATEKLARKARSFVDFATKRAEANKIESEAERGAALKKVEEDYNTELETIANDNQGPQKDTVLGVDKKSDFYDDPAINVAIDAFKKAQIQRELGPMHGPEEAPMQGPLTEARTKQLQELLNQHLPATSHDDLFDAGNLQDVQAKTAALAKAAKVEAPSDAKVGKAVEQLVEDANSPDVATAKAVTKTVEETKQKIEQKLSRPEETPKPREKGRVTNKQRAAQDWYAAQKDASAKGDEQAQKVVAVVDKFLVDASAHNDPTRPRRILQAAKNHFDNGKLLDGLRGTLSAVLSKPEPQPYEYSKTSDGKLNQIFATKERAQAHADQLNEGLKEGEPKFRAVKGKKGDGKFVVARPLVKVSEAVVANRVSLAVAAVHEAKALAKGNDTSSQRASEVLDDAINDWFQTAKPDEIWAFMQDPENTDFRSLVNQFTWKAQKAQGVNLEALVKGGLESKPAEMRELLSRLHEDVFNRREEHADEDTSTKGLEDEFDQDTQVALMEAADAWIERDNAEGTSFEDSDTNEGFARGAGGERIALGSMPAGAGFHYSMVPYDAAQNILGKHKLQKSGEVSRQAFKNMAGVFGPIKDAELEFYATIVPEAFNGDRINVPVLAKGLAEKGPQVEVHRYGQAGKVSQIKLALDLMTHEWFDVTPQADELVDRIWNGASDLRLKSLGFDEATIEKGREYFELQKKLSYEPRGGVGPQATQYYNQISIFPKVSADGKPQPIERVDVVLPRNVRETPLWQQDDLHENLPNTLGWAMFQVVERNGKPTMVIEEVQSRWAQSKRQDEERAKASGIGTTGFPVEGQPLLDFHQSLVLKAAIAEARKRGIDNIVLSDGETAMMTEGHDAENYARYHTVYVGEDGVTNYSEPMLKQEAEQQLAQMKRAGVRGMIEPAQLAQEGGMRLAYDTTMPSILKKLTGEQGVKVDLGVHKNARVGEGGAQTKTNATGLRFSLTNLNPRVDYLFGRSGERVSTGSKMDTLDLVPSLENVVERALIKQGLTKPQVETMRPYFDGLKDLLNLSDVRFGELVNTELAGKPVLGLARVKGSDTVNGPFRQIWLAADKAAQGTSKYSMAKNIGIRLAHEAGHAVEHLYNEGKLGQVGRQTFENARRYFAEATPEEMSRTLQTMAETLLPREWQQLRETQALMKPTDADEAFATAYGMWAMSGAAKTADRALGMAMLPRTVRNFAHMLTDWAHMLWSAVKSAVMLRPGEAQPNMKNAVDALTKNFVELKREVATAEKEIRKTFELFDIDAFKMESRRVQARDVLRDGSVGVGIKQLARMATGELGEPTTVGDDILRKGSMMFEPLTQLAARVPNTAKAIEVITGAADYSKQLIDHFLEPLLGPMDPATGKRELDKTQKRYIEIAETDANVNQLISDIERWQNRGPNDKPQLMDLDKPQDASIAQRLNSMSENQRNAVKAYELAHRESVKRVQDMFMTLGELRNKYYAEKKLALALPEMHKDIPHIVNEIFTADQLLRQNQQGEFAKIYMEVSQKLGDQALANDMFKFALESNDGISKLRDFYATRKGFSSEMRLGQFFARVYDKGGVEIDQQTFESAGAADKFRKEQEKLGNKVKTENVRRGFKVTFNKDFADLLDAVENRVQQNLLNSKNLDPALARQLIEDGTVNVKSELQRYVQASQIGQPGSRRLADSAEHLNMVDLHKAYAKIVANALTNSLRKAKLDFELLEPNLRKDVAHSKQIKQAFTNYTTPDSKLGSAIAKLNTINFLGFNIPSHIAELFQGFSTVLPQIVAEHGSVIGSTKMLLGTMKDLAKYYTEKNLGSMLGKAEWKQWHNAEEQLLLIELADKGLLGRHAFNEGTTDDAMAPVVRRIGNNAEGSLTRAINLAGKPIKAYADTSMNIYENFTRFNQRLAAIVGYRLAKSKGMSPADARDWATNFTKTTTYSAGKAGRSVAPFSMDDHTLGQVAMSLQGYNNGWIAQMARYLQHAKMSREGAEFYGVSKEKQANAKKAFATMMVVQLGLAGAIGMPFVGGMLALWQKITGMDVQGKAYEMLGSLMDQDEQDGGLLADVVMRGTMNAMLERAGLPIDMQSRFAIAGTPGMNSYDGFNAGQLFGPTASIVASVARGVESAAKDHDLFGFAKNVVPPAFKKALDVWANGDATTKYGSRAGLDATEKYLYAVGFVPQKVRAMRDFDRFTQHAAEARQARDNREIGTIIDTLNSGDMASAQMKLHEVVAKSQGTKTVQEVATKVALQMEERYFAQDLRQRVAMADAPKMSNVARGMGLNFGPSDQMLREQYRQQVLMQLGAPQHDLRQRMLRARKIDNATQQDPFKMFQTALR